MQSRTSTRDAVSGFINPFSSVSKTMNCSLYFGVAAKPAIAKDLIEPDGIGRKAVADFIDLLLVENLTLTTP